MTVYKNQTFARFQDRESGRIFANIEFVNCRFDNCTISAGRASGIRSTVRGIRLANCSSADSTLYSGILEDVVVDGLKTEGLLQTWGAVFRHVILRGKIGRLMITHDCDPTKLYMLSAQRAALDAANDAYYEGVDWALDISSAEFEECDIRGIPARLIRRDPETQVVVKRDNALQGGWRALDLSKTDWSEWISIFLEHQPDDEDLVLVAPKQSPRFRDDLAGIQLLRRAGVAEPD